MVPPPRQVPFALAGSFPDLQLLVPTAANVVQGYVRAAPGFGALTASIQTQGPPAATSGWARAEPITLPDGSVAENSTGTAVLRLSLTDETLSALVPVLAEALARALADEQLRGVIWNLEEGLVPGEESGGAPTPNWSLAPFCAPPGITCATAAYTGATRQLQLSCTGGLARHLGIYGEFLRAGRPLRPTAWKSRLPSTVPGSLETATLKYLGVLAPSVPVAGIPSPSDPQTVTVVLPAEADAVRLSFAGFGAGTWAAVPCALGVMLSFVLDYALPAIIGATAASASDGAAWYREVVADPSVQAEAMAAAAGLVGKASIGDVQALLGWLAVNVPSLLLGDALAGLRAAVDDRFGTDSVADAAPMVGWGAQTLRALIAAPAAVYSPLAYAPAGIDVEVGSSSAVTIEVSVLPDARRGEWPDAAQGCDLLASYAGGFTRSSGGPLPSRAGAALAVSLPSVRTGGAIELFADVVGPSGGKLARGAATVTGTPPGPATTVSIEVIDEPVMVTTASTFTRRRTLSYDAGAGTYSWGPAADAGATEQSLDCHPTSNRLCELVEITLAPAARSLGYTWRVTDGGVPDCASGSPTTISYAFQNVGVVSPAAVLKTIACGFGARPHLAYATDAGVYVDPRRAAPAVRAVALSAAGPFDLAASSSLGFFSASDLSDVALHPGGYAIGVSAAASRVEIIALATAAVPDAGAPRARVVAGAGERVGLVLAPVACAVAPSGTLHVLEDGNARVQAFDVGGNPVPAFGGSPVMALRQEVGAVYLDLAVSASGLMYVLSNVNGGARPSDYRLDVYAADGSFLARTAAVNGARIVVDSAERVYTLDYAAITGPGGRTEPAVSQWTLA